MPLGKEKWEGANRRNGHRVGDREPGSRRDRRSDCHWVYPTLAFVGRRCRLTVQRERLGSIARSPICRGRPAAFRCSDDVESRKAPPCSAAISAAQIRAHVVTFGKRPWSPLVVAFSVSVNGASSGVGSRAVEIAIVIVFRLVPTTAFHSSVNRGQGIGLRLGPLWL